MIEESPEFVRSCIGNMKMLIKMMKRFDQQEVHFQGLGTVSRRGKTLKIVLDSEDETLEDCVENLS